MSEPEPVPLTSTPASSQNPGERLFTLGGFNFGASNPLKRKCDNLIEVAETCKKYVKAVNDVGDSNTLANKLVEDITKSCDKELKIVVNAFLQSVREEYAYVHVLKATECSVCYESLSDKPCSSLNVCHHVFCDSCIGKIKVGSSHKCPKCRIVSKKTIKCII
jgi:hypothetical protein